MKNSIIESSATTASPLRGSATWVSPTDWVFARWKYAWPRWAASGRWSWTWRWRNGWCCKGVEHVTKASTQWRGRKSVGLNQFRVCVFQSARPSFAKGPSKDIAFEGHTPICLANNHVRQCSFQRITWLRHSCSPDVTVWPTPQVL